MYSTICCASGAACATFLERIPLSLPHLRPSLSQCRARQHHQGERATRQRAQKHEKRRQALDAYRSRFSKALQAELDEEMKEMKERLRWSRERLQEEGLALFDLSVRFDGQLYRDRVVRFYECKGSGMLPPHHQFTQGDIVAISKRNPLDEEESLIEGVVMECARRYIRVAVQASRVGDIDLQLKWRLDLSANRISFDRCMLAINLFASPLIRQGSSQSTTITAPPVASHKALKNKSEHTFVIGEGAMAIRGLILGAELVKESVKGLGKNESREHDKAHAALTEALTVANSPPSRMTNKNLGTPKDLIAEFLQDPQVDLNSSQKQAVEKAICQKITLWQGPPGTGKTKTLVHYLKGFCRNEQGQVLACADSNVAVDNLVEGLLDLGLRVVRIGQPVKVREELRGTTVEAQVAAHTLMKKALALRKEAILQQKASREINSDKKRKLRAQNATSTWEKALQLEKQAIKDVLDNADVIAATCVGSGDSLLDNRHFRVCVIDEATQTTEPASLIPILISGADSIVLVGDPAQLPPTVLSTNALEAGLTVSLFERLEDFGIKPLLLDTQYRMHPMLASWPSTAFYGGRLLSSVLPKDRLAPKGLKWLNEEKPLIFIECATGIEETTAFGKSWFNRVEASEVKQVVDFLINGKDIQGGCKGIGIISPYAAQVRLLLDIFANTNAETQECISDLEIKTVDGFQGCEKEVIVISTVRSNPDGQLGFVTDPRRMNVALTRAKRGLIVIGSSRTLESSSKWEDWLKTVRVQHLYFDQASSSLGEVSA